MRRRDVGRGGGGYDVKGDRGWGLEWGRAYGNGA